MKNILKLLPLIGLLILVFIFKNDISNFVVEKIIFSKEIYMSTPNDYHLDYNFQYVKETDNFIAKDKQQLLNIIYTILNNGTNNFYFFCDYDNCENDVNDLADSHKLVNINNYVHPYNNYRKVNFTINSFGKIELTIDKLYTNDNINSINNKIDEIMKEIVTDNMTNKEKIIKFHDYIIDHTVYDSNYLNINLNDIDNPSHKALGPLFFGKSLCGGYADVMAIFLDKLHIPNYRISSDNHIWNLVYLDNNWYHLDLTWDDPVTDNGSNIRLDKFLLITTEQLENINTGYHTYDKSVYLEAK